ncbi:hypothetical protein F5Y17DRAFT_91094 [Xylariaceae sp. FL0594]|nr:hypothetical protein F5Y17DRAFT_91094 [Xylariaceae sp. FL0594]
MADTHDSDHSEGSSSGSSHTRPSSSVRTVSIDDDDDEHDHIADGFRPLDAARHAGLPPVAPHRSASFSGTGAVSPASLRMSKSQLSFESLAIRNDGSGAIFDGTTAPLHQYQTHMQGVTPPRPASLATTESSLGGLRRWFQGTTDQDERKTGQDGQAVAVTTRRVRQTEQLPPYTRYPIGLSIQSQPAVQVPQPTLQIAGAGGIGLAAHNPEFSTEDLGRPYSLESQQSIRASFASEGNLTKSNSGDLPDTAEKKQIPNWREVARRKVGGLVPTWAVAVGGVLVLVGIVVGAAVGTHRPNATSGHKPPDNTPPPNGGGSVPGFQPLDSVPPGLPPLEEGQFGMPLFDPRSTNSCLKDLGQGHTWDCRVSGIMAQLLLTVARKEGVPTYKAYTLDLQPMSSRTLESYVYTYGQQPPSVRDQQLQIVADVFQEDKGPAWGFAIPYTKTVILPQIFLMPPGNNESGSGRHAHPRRSYPLGFKRTAQAQVGDRPWICTWPATTLEVFIYPNQNASHSSMYSSGGSRGGGDDGGGAPSWTQSPGEEPTGMHHDRTNYRYGGGSHGGGDHPEQQTTEYYEDHHRYHDGYTYTPGPHPWPQSQAPTPTPSTSEEEEEEQQQTSSSPDGASSPSSSSSDQPSSSSSGGVPGQYPSYPKQIKIAERRDPEQYDEAARPTCRQVVIMDEGQEARPVLDDEGNPVIVEINENGAGKRDSDTAVGGQNRRSRSQSRHRRHDNNNNNPFPFFGPPDTVPQKGEGEGEGEEGRDEHGASQAEMSGCGCIWWKM